MNQTKIETCTLKTLIRKHSLDYWIAVLDPIKYVCPVCGSHLDVDEKTGGLRCFSRQGCPANGKSLEWLENRLEIGGEWPVKSIGEEGK